MKRITIATRKSALALWQANHVADLLRRQHAGLEVELLPMVTRGDIILDQPLAQIGGKGLFLKELEKALLSGEADIAVHSMKDVPMEQVPGLEVEVMLKRANPFDALLSREGEALSELAAGSVVGTSSLRRQCQLKSIRPDLELRDLRGNVNTRVRKLEEGEYDAIILACAGLERLEMAHLITETLSPPAWLPAATQGTIGIQSKSGDDAVMELIAPLADVNSSVCTLAERTVATALQGSCQVPLAVFAVLDGDAIRIRAMIGMPDGTGILRADRIGPPEDGEAMAASLAEELLAQGADRIVAELA